MPRFKIDINEIKIERYYEVVLTTTRDRDGETQALSVLLTLNEIATAEGETIYYVYEDFPIDSDVAFNEVMEKVNRHVFDSYKKLALAIEVARKLNLDYIRVMPVDC